MPAPVFGSFPVGVAVGVVGPPCWTTGSDVVGVGGVVVPTVVVEPSGAVVVVGGGGVVVTGGTELLGGGGQLSLSSSPSLECWTLAWV